MHHPTKRTSRPSPWTLLTAVNLASIGSAQGAAPPPQPPDTPDVGSLLDGAFFLRLGFSFIVGLAAGFALKVAFKIALVVIGLVLVGVFALQYAGLAEVDWSSVEIQYDTGADWVGAQGGALLDFMGRNLPSAASFLAGLAVGLKL